MPSSSFKFMQRIFVTPIRHYTKHTRKFIEKFFNLGIAYKFCISSLFQQWLLSVSQWSKRDLESSSWHSTYPLHFERICEYSLHCQCPWSPFTSFTLTTLYFVWYFTCIHDWALCLWLYWNTQGHKPPILQCM